MVEVWGLGVLCALFFSCLWIGLLFHKKDKKKECHQVASHEKIFIKDSVVYDQKEMLLLLSFAGRTAGFFMNIKHPDFNAMRLLLPGSQICLTPLDECIEGLEEYRPSSYARFEEVLPLRSLAARAHA